MTKDTSATFFNLETGKAIVTLNTLGTSDINLSAGDHTRSRIISKEKVVLNISDDIKSSNRKGNTREIIIDPLIRINNLIEMYGKDKNIKFDHITYDESVNENYDYQVIRSQGHDGLLYLTDKTINDAVFPLINKTTYGTNTINKEDLERVKEIQYVIGDIRLETEYGTINSGAGKIAGMTDTVYIPVKCKYIFE